MNDLMYFATLTIHFNYNLSVTGLQELTSTANSFSIAHGIKFNATKTICTSFDTRIKSPTWAFHGLQCAGLCAGGVAPTVSAHMSIQPILAFGCTTLNITRYSVTELDQVQAKLLKSALGLPKLFS